MGFNFCSHWSRDLVRFCSTSLSDRRRPIPRTLPLHAFAADSGLVWAPQALRAPGPVTDMASTGPSKVRPSHSSPTMRWWRTRRARIRTESPSTSCRGVAAGSRSVLGLCLCMRSGAASMDAIEASKKSMKSAVSGFRMNRQGWWPTVFRSVPR